MKIPIKIRILLWYLDRQAGMKIYDMTPEQARNSSSTLSENAERFLDYAPIPLFEISDHHAVGRDSKIPIRVYRPTAQEGLPVIIFFHGGGFVLQSIDSHDKVCRRIARDNEAIVISVDYRLAPEYKFPTAVYDAYDATVWIAQNPQVHKGDVSRLVVMGDSAGGNLAAVTCLLCRDLGGPDIKYQVLIYPCTDGALNKPSIKKYGQNYFLTKEIMDWFIDHYKSRAEDIYDPYMSPLVAKDLSNLPPAFLFTAEYDPLKDEGRMYAERLKEAGNEVTFKEYPGMIHGFVSMPRMSRHIHRTYKDIKDILAKALKQELLNSR